MRFEARHTVFRMSAIRWRSCAKASINRSPAEQVLDYWVWDHRETLRPVTASSILTSTLWDTSPKESTAGSRLTSCAGGTSIRKTIATPAGRGRCAPADAIMKRSYATETRVTPTFTIAIGYETGRTLACESMARSQPRIQGFCSSLPKGKHNEKHAPTEQEGRPHRRFCRS